MPDIYKLLDKYQLVSYILTFLKDALFPSKPVWRAILRQHAVQNTDNGTGVDAQRERMVVAQCCRYKLCPNCGVSVGMHPLFHQYAENYYV